MNEKCFTLLALIMGFNAFYGFNIMISQNQYCNYIKQMRSLDSIFENITLDNWKSSQYRNNNRSLKTLALAIIVLQISFLVPVLLNKLIDFNFYSFHIDEFILVCALCYSVRSLDSYFSNNQHLYQPALALVILYCITHNIELYNAIDFSYICLDDY